MKIRTMGRFLKKGSSQNLANYQVIGKYGTLSIPTNQAQSAPRDRAYEAGLRQEK